MKPLLLIDEKTLIDTNAQSPSKALKKLKLRPWVLSSLWTLKDRYRLTVLFEQSSKAKTDKARQNLLTFLQSQGVVFDDVLIYPSKLDSQLSQELLQKFLGDYYQDDKQDNQKDNEVFLLSLENLDKLKAELGINSITYNADTMDWQLIGEKLLGEPVSNIGTRPPRHATITRKTKETDIAVAVWLDETGVNDIKTGVGFFDHMLDQIATHGGFRMNVSCTGDLWIDEHHTVEDVAIALGQALKQAIGDKRGIARFGFVLPMDECKASCAMDLSGRPFIKFKGKFNRQKVGDFSTELTEHFFQSMAFAMMATLHIKTKGDNDHHKIESLFKVFGRTLRQAIRIEGNELPSSKGVL